MKDTIRWICCIAFLACLGCGNTSPVGGVAPSAGTGANTKDTFTIKGPMLPITLKQGDRETTNLTLDRGSDFKKTVKLNAQAPTGLKVEFAQDNIKPSDPAEHSMTVQADKAATLGEQTIHVTATPESGSSTSLDIKVKVEEKK